MTTNTNSITVLGGPTVVISLGGMRVVVDPTFDAAGSDQGYLVKTEGPALSASELGPSDLVLVSHEDHPDNLDASGRRYALGAKRLLCGVGSAERLGGRAEGLPVWESTEVRRPDGGALTVTAVPAIHGPEDGERTEDGFVNCEVVGFILSGEGLPMIYVSGDNASVQVVTEISARFSDIDWAVLNVGAARVPTKFNGRPLSLTSQHAAAVAQILAPAGVVPAHYSGWTHFTEGEDTIRPAFDDAGVGELLHLVEHGTAIPLS